MQWISEKNLVQPYFIDFLTVNTFFLILNKTSRCARTIILVNVEIKLYSEFIY